METAHEPLCAARGFNDQSNDCFKMLPWEIREAIANNLTTRDALALRESSRSFVPLLESPTFWASRFKPGADRGFLFEKTSTAEARDWFTLYRRTSRNQSPPGLKNRIRIWNLIDHIYHLVKMSLDDGVPRLTAPIMHSDKLRVVEAAANIVQPSPDEIYDVFSDGCRFFKTQSASIPQDLLSVELSFVEHEDYYHLTGLSFDSGCGKTLRLGYASSHTMIYNAQTFGGLKGLILAIDDRGIRAVQIVRGDRNRSNWFGSPKGTPVTERLAVMDTTQPIHIGVDVSSQVFAFIDISNDFPNYRHTRLSALERAFRVISPTDPTLRLLCLFVQRHSGTPRCPVERSTSTNGHLSKLHPYLWSISRLSGCILEALKGQISGV